MARDAAPNRRQLQVDAAGRAVMKALRVTELPGIIGNRNRLLVMADLLDLGWEVYLPASTTCTSDVVAWRNGRFLRIEVRVGRRTSTGKLYWSMPASDFDVYAVVTTSPSSFTIFYHHPDKSPVLKGEPPFTS